MAGWARHNFGFSRGRMQLIPVTRRTVYGRCWPGLLAAGVAVLVGACSSSPSQGGTGGAGGGAAGAGSGGASGGGSGGATSGGGGTLGSGGAAGSGGAPPAGAGGAHRRGAPVPAKPAAPAIQPAHRATRRG